jgi:hypothetical protein
MSLRGLLAAGQRVDQKGPETVRSLPIASAIAIASVAVPSAASAANGWKLSTITNSSQGFTITSSATRCSKSKFGTWKFHGRISGEGKFADSRFTVKITKDGKLHRPAHIRVTGTAPDSSKAAIKQNLQAQRLRYVAGSPPQLETLARDGGRAAIRAFQPSHKHC